MSMRFRKKIQALLRQDLISETGKVDHSSPLAPPGFPDIPSIAGLGMAAGDAGIKYSGRDDLAVWVLDSGTRAAGLFTRSALPAAPIDVTREHIRSASPRALVVNSANANAFTGMQGLEDCRTIAKVTAEALGCKPQEVLMASTGVIGEPLPVKRITDRIPEVVGNIAPDGWQAVAKAIMTTDTFAKGASARASVDGQPVTLCGVAKGSGMIAPNMATMLAFCFTDAEILQVQLHEMLINSAERTFNAITVDSDTSTSDMLLLFATGKACNIPPQGADDPRFKGFREALDELLKDLAMQVVRDGEGASKLIEVRITGAVSDASARKMAESIANSPLVKTAIAGGDANWGRIIMALGKSGESMKAENLLIRIGGEMVAKGGQRAENHDESLISRHLEGSEILIEAELQMGDGEFTVWTCDLTHGYISINADYRS